MSADTPNPSEPADPTEPEEPTAYVGEPTSNQATPQDVDDDGEDES